MKRIFLIGYMGSGKTAMAGCWQIILAWSLSIWMLILKTNTNWRSPGYLSKKEKRNFVRWKESVCMKWVILKTWWLGQGVEHLVFLIIWGLWTAAETLFISNSLRSIWLPDWQRPKQESDPSFRINQEMNYYNSSKTVWNIGALLSSGKTHYRRKWQRNRKPTDPIQF